MHSYFETKLFFTLLDGGWTGNAFSLGFGALPNHSR
jgi:hypothetical protein